MVNLLCPAHMFASHGLQTQVYSSVLPVPGASPDSIIGISSLNGAPGTPSDDEDLPHNLPGVVSSGPSPTGSQGSQGMWEGGATACPEKELSYIRPETRFVEPESMAGHETLQRSLSEGLDAIEAPKGPGERPLGAASPKLLSSFPTHTRLSSMLHIDSDEDEERSGAADIAPVPLSPLLMNGGRDDEDFPEQQELEQLDSSRQKEEPRSVCAMTADVPPDVEVALEADVGLALDDVLEPDVFSEVEEAPFTDSGEVPEEDRVAGEDLSSEVDTGSMATAPQTAFSLSDSCPVTLTIAIVSIFKVRNINIPVVYLVDCFNVQFIYCTVQFVKINKQL